MNVYGLVGGKVKDALGDGHDFTYQDPNIFPVATAGIMKFGEADPETGVAKHTVFFWVFLPDGVNADDRDLLGSTANAYFSQARYTQTLWIGGGYALRLGKLGFGFGGYALIGSTTYFLDLDLIAPAGNPFVVLSAATI